MGHHSWSISLVQKIYCQEHKAMHLDLVADTSSLVRAGGARRAVDRRQLAELPAADAQQEAEDIRLLVLVQLFEIFVGSHFAKDDRNPKIGLHARGA